MMDIAVSGIGLSSVLALHREHSWQYLLQARRLTDLAPVSFLDKQLAVYARACPMTSAPAHRVFNLGRHVLDEALLNANLSAQSFAPDRWGMAVSLSKQIISQHLKPSEIYEPHQLGHWLVQRQAWQGRRLNTVAACASGGYSILNAARWLQEDVCDAVCAGAVESCLQDLYVAGFLQMGVLSKNPRPFDRDRDGFMIAEGAAVLILEKRQQALDRGAKIYAWLKGGALGSDTCAPTAFYADGSSIARVVNRALKNCNLSAGDIDYVHLHGTGTRLNDVAEARAMQQVFSGHPVYFSSSKGSFGHTLGASGAMGAALACLSLRDARIAPTTGLTQIDPTCALRLSATALSVDIKTAMAISFGFGGSIAVLIFQKA